MLPGRGISRAKEPFKETSGVVLMMPRQLGPRRRIPLARAVCKTCCSRATPAPPSSLKPAVMTMAVLIPFSPHSAMTWGTASRGTIMMPKSTASGMSATLGKALTLMTLAARGLTG